MRKVKFAFLFVLVLCIAAATFVACNPTDGDGTGTPTIPVQPDVTPPDSQGFVSVSGGDAWDMFIDAARESNSDTGHFVYSDVVIGLDYAKDALGYSYALKVQSDIDLNNDANSQILLELWKADGDGTLVEMLLGLYYFDSTVVYDCTGLKSGATVVKTDDLNLTAVVKTLRELLTSGEEGRIQESCPIHPQRPSHHGRRSCGLHHKPHPQPVRVLPVLKRHRTARSVLPCPSVFPTFWAACWADCSLPVPIPSFPPTSTTWSKTFSA